MINLKTSQNEPYAYELCPLTEKNAKEAAEHSGFDANAFLAAVDSLGVRGLAAFPFTLKMLLVEFHDGTLQGKSRRNLYRSFALRLCADAHDPERRANFGLRAMNLPPVDRLFHAASFIATILIAVGRSVVLEESRGEAGTELSLEEISVIPAIGSSPTLDELRTALRTGVFGCSSGRFAFLHQTMAECLAADLLNARPLVQLCSLFLQLDAAGRHVVPQLAQTASWLSEQNSDFFDVLLVDDPETLLRSDVRHHSNSQKKRVVENLIARAKSGELPLHTERNLGGLSYPTISETLRVDLNAADLDINAARLCIDIVKQNDIGDLVPDLWEVLARQGIAGALRIEAANALKVILSDSDPAALLGLLSPTVLCNDQIDEIRGLALRSLVPRVLPVSDVFKYLSRPKGSVMGLYRLFIYYELPKLISIADIPAALRFLSAADLEDQEDGYHDDKLTLSVLRIAVEAVEAPGIASELALFLANLPEEQLSRFSHRNQLDFAKLLRESSSKRDCLREALLDLDAIWADEKTDSRALRLFFDWDALLVQGPDIVKLLERWKTDSSIKRQRIARILRGALGYGFNMVATFVIASDALVAFLEGEPGCASLVEYWLRPWSLDGERVRSLRASLAEERKWREQAREEEPQKDWADEIARALQALDNGPSWFVWVIRLLHWGPDWKHDSQGGEIRDLTGWHHLGPEQKSRIRVAARLFVIECDPGVRDSDNLTNFDEAAYHAAAICFDLLSSDKVFSDRLLQKWLFAVVWCYDSDHEMKTRVLAWAHSVAPELTRDQIVAKIRKEALSGTGIIVETQFIGKWGDPDLANKLFELMADSSVKSAAPSYLALFLAKDYPTLFLERIRTLQFSPPDGMSPNCWANCLGHALYASPTQFWPVLRQRLESDRPLAHNVLASAAAHDLHYEKADWSSLHPSELAALFRLTCREYPIANDPPFESGIQQHNVLRHVGELRSHIEKSLSAFGNDDACKELLRLSEEFPDGRVALLWHYHNARNQARLRRWAAPKPSEVSKLLTQSETRLVRDAPELLGVVIESLDRYARRLSASSNPRVYALWDIGGTPQRPLVRRPRSEEYLAIEISAWLQDDLGRSKGAIINREVVPRIGQRTDIVVDSSSTNPSDESNLRVVIEVKGNWNQQVKTALKDQLVDLYLKHQAGAVGIYLVCWFGSGRAHRNRMASKSLTNAKTEAADWALTYDGRSLPLVESYVLDCELSGRAPKASVRIRKQKSGKMD